MPRRRCLCAAPHGRDPLALTACLKPGDAILVHTSPIYTTTQVTIDAMGLKPIRADFNDLEQLKAVCAQHKDEIRGAWCS